MKRFRFLLTSPLFLFVAVLALYYGAHQWNDPKISNPVSTNASPLVKSQNTEWGTVESVNDGDTLKVMLNGRQVTVRFCGIDAPEKAQPLGLEAKEWLEKLVQDAGGKVGIVATDIDRYGRVVAEVFLMTEPEQSVQQEMLMAGMAYIYPQYIGSCPNAEPFKMAESIGKENKAGVWARNDQRPWDYRKAKRAN
jgi:micrococcal nuclease